MLQPAVSLSELPRELVYCICICICICLYIVSLCGYISLCSGREGTQTQTSLIFLYCSGREGTQTQTSLIFLYCSGREGTHFAGFILA
jgi:hypothetical protein